MSEFAGNLPRKFISVRLLGFKSSAHNLLEERESEIPQNVDEMDKANTVEIGETSPSPAKGSSKLQGAPMRAESIGTRLEDEDRDLTMAEKDCILTGSDDDVEDLTAFVTERLQCLSERSVEKLTGDENVKVEEFLCRSVGVGESGGYNRQSVCPNMTMAGNVDADDKRFSPGENNQIFRKELGSANITSTPKRAAWPTYTKIRSSVLSGRDKPLLEEVMFDVGSGNGTVGGVELSRVSATNTSDGVPESFVTSGGFSTSEGFAQRQADGRFAGACMGDEREVMVRIPTVDEMFGQEATRERGRSINPVSRRKVC